MSDQWEFYPCQMGEHTAFVFVNVTIGEVLAERGRTGQVLVRVRLKHPRADGLTSNDEFQSLYDLEDGFNNYCQSMAADMVGRLTVAGYRDFVVYAADPDRVAHGLATIARDEHGYQVEVLVRDDPEFEVYWQHLFPGPIEQQLIRNRQILEQLESHGDPCEQPRRIDHWIYFASSEHRDQFEQRVGRDGFVVGGRFEPSGDETRYGVQLFRDDLPEYEHINDLTLGLYRLAEEFEGEYDGWETTVLADGDGAGGSG